MKNLSAELMASIKCNRNSIFLFLFCLAVLFGPTFAIFDNYNYSESPDIKTYLGMANFDFNQSPIRKYRVIVPLIASAINFVCKPVFSRLIPMTFSGPDFSLGMSFLVVNCILMSVFGMIIYKFCRMYGASKLSSAIGLISILTCRWTAYFAGLPVVDSFYLIIAALTLYSLKTKNHKLQVWVIFLGPWAKEAFIFLAPLIFFCSDIKKGKQVMLFILSGILVFSFRYLFEKHSLGPLNTSIKADFSHFENFGLAIHRLFSFHGVYEIFSLIGFWSLLFIGLIKKEILNSVKGTFSPMIIWFLIIVLVHAIISSELARMLYLAVPVLALWVSLISEKLICLYWIEKK